MLNNETFFYREHSVFDDIAVKALDHVRAANAATRRLPIWHCGVSTGQEAYSMAMLLAEQGERWAGWTAPLVGTDVSYQATSRAGVGHCTPRQEERGVEKEGASTGGSRGAQEET